MNLPAATYAPERADNYGRKTGKQSITANAAECHEMARKRG